MRGSARVLGWMATGAAVWAWLAVRPLFAQGVEPGHAAVGSRLTFGGDVTATTSPPDHDAYFNFTNYDQNVLRAAQVRLMGEWRVSTSVAFLGELRAENGAGIGGAAWFVRWHPSTQHDFDVQVGRIPPVIGRFAREPYGRDNLLVDAPLAYQYLVPLRPDALPATADDLIRMRGRGWESSFPIGSAAVGPGIPLVSAYRWDTGAEAHWHTGPLDLAGALTRGSAAVPVVGRDGSRGQTWSGRVAIDGPAGLTVGVSGARGPWIDDTALGLAPAPDHPDVQTVVATDVQVGWGRWLARGEELRSVFGLPVLESVAAWSGYAEIRYRIRPRWDLATRVEHLDFSRIRGTLGGGEPTTWDAPVRRLTADIAYRVTRRWDVRVGWQMNWRDGGRVDRRGYPALQILYWF